MIDIILLLVCILAFSALGRRMLRWIKLEFGSSREELLFSFGLGVGTLSFFTLLMALAGVLYRWVFLILFGVLTVALLPDMVKIIRRLTNYLGRSRLGRIGKLNKIFLAIVIVHIALTLLGALAPPTSFDGLGLHLQLPKIYIENHRSTFIPAHQQAMFPFLMEMLYALGLMLKGDILAKLFHFSMNVALILLIYALAERLYSKAVAFLSIGIYSSLQLVSWLATTAYIDLGFTLYVFLAIYAYLNWLHTNTAKYIYLSALFLGFSLLTKYLGMVHIGLLGSFILLNCLVRKEGLVKSLKNVALFVTISLVISFPFYIRNWVWVGNPFWPALYDVFGGSYFSESLGQVVRLNSGTGLFPKVTNKAILSTVSEFIRSPWLISRKTGIDALGPILLMFLPALVLLRGRINKELKFFLSYSLIIYTIVYFIFIFATRYLCSILPLLCIACAYAVEELKKNDWVLKKILPAFLILPMGFNILLTARQVHSAIPVVFGRQSRFEYLSNPLLHPYGGMRGDVNVKVWESVKQLLPKDAKLYLPLITTIYYADAPIDREFSWFADYSGTEEIYKKLGITHVLGHGLNERPSLGIGKGIKCKLIRTWEQGYHTPHWDNEISLYEIIYNE